MDIHTAMEESYKNGYAKGCDDTRRELEAELAFTRKFIHDHGLEFALASAWEKAGNPPMMQQRGHWIQKNGVIFCSECMTCGSPHWKVCPVCETKMEV